MENKPLAGDELEKSLFNNMMQEAFKAGALNERREIRTFLRQEMRHLSQARIALTRFLNSREEKEKKESGKSE